MKARYIFEDLGRAIAEYFEDLWFDLSRKVSTSGEVSLQSAGIAWKDFRDSEMYQPARPFHIRRALREMPVEDVSEYSFVDLGSGKGRTLFVAAELPFKQVVGVEFSALLHEQACTNIRRFQARKRRCASIESLHQNAADFVFPPDKLVLYLFNPFGAATVERVLNNLEASLRQHPRHIVVVLLWPRCEEQVARMTGMRLRRKVKQYQIFETHPPKPLAWPVLSERPAQSEGQSAISAGSGRAAFR